MKNLFILSGSITKKEILVAIKNHILENTCVSEANSPYANYYGQLPRKAKPNSIFLFTNRFYFLEEILSCAQGAEKCLMESINIASAHILFKNRQLPAVRIKNFADYSQIAALQNCLLAKGITFLPKLYIEGEVETRVNKIFAIEEVDHGIYMDMDEDNKGYFFHEHKMPPEKFMQITTKMKNNAVGKLFDMVQGEILRDGNVMEMVRVFAEGLEVSFLQTMKQEFNKLASRSNILVS